MIAVLILLFPYDSGTKDKGEIVGFLVVECEKKGKYKGSLGN